jgi:hypothetical protein
MWLYSALLCFTLLYSALLCFTLLYSATYKRCWHSTIALRAGAGMWPQARFTLLYSALLCFTLRHIRGAGIPLSLFELEQVCGLRPHALAAEGLMH